MSNDWFNIRFGAKHFHWEKHKLRPYISHNSYWEDGAWKTKGVPWFQIYTLFGLNLFKG